MYMTQHIYTRIYLISNLTKDKTIMITLIKWMKNMYGQTDRKIFILITFLYMCEHVQRHVVCCGRYGS